jgi:hypothetical protein
MNITVAKIRELLVKDYGWDDGYIDDSNISINEILDDTLKIINDILKEQVKRMYTEEEVYDLLVEWNMYQKGEPRVDEDEIPNGYMSFNEWFKKNI